MKLKLSVALFCPLTLQQFTPPLLCVLIQPCHPYLHLTAWQTFTNSLYELASRPEYVEPIRQEIEAVITEDGWTKVAMARMRKLDSFLKEAQRVNGIGSCKHCTTDNSQSTNNLC